MSTATRTLDLHLASILIATDFSHASEKPLNHALAIARRFGAHFYVAHIVSALGFAMAGPEATCAAEDVVCHDASQLENELAASGAFEGLTHNFIIRDGRVWEEIERLIQEKSIDLLVIGTHGRRGMGKLLLGSTAEQIFRHAPCPVLTVGPGCYQEPRIENTRPDRKFLFVTDFGQASLNALPHAISFANHFAASLALFHVMPVVLVPEDFRVYTAADRDQMRKDLRAASLQRLQQLVRTSPMKVEPEFVVEASSSSPVSEDILVAAEKIKADLIVMGLHRSTHVATASHLPWTTAYEVACSAGCPVLTVRSAQSAA
jgi:nucleotide-binding universal stress UspA family protein